MTIQFQSNPAVKATVQPVVRKNESSPIEKEPSKQVPIKSDPFSSSAIESLRDQVLKPSGSGVDCCSGNCAETCCNGNCTN